MKGRENNTRPHLFPFLVVAHFPCFCLVTPRLWGKSLRLLQLMYHKSRIAHYFTESTSYCSITLSQNLSTTSMRKYSKSAKRMKAMLIRIHWTRGQILPEGGILSVALLFRLIVIRSRVRSRPSLWKYERNQYHLDQQQQPIIMSCSSFSTSIITNR